MSGPASSGQHVWIGRRDRSTSFPSHTTCWHGAREISFGAMCITCLPIGIQRSSTSRNPVGGSGSLRNARSFPMSRSASRGSAPASAPIARATRRVVPNRLPSTGIAWPLGFSKSSAGPPALSTRQQTSVISSFGSTSARTRFSSPACSSCDRKSRRSRYLISLDDRCRSGAVHRDDSAGDVARPVRREKHGDCRDFLGPGVASKRNLLFSLLSGLLFGNAERLGFRRVSGLGAFTQGHARVDRIYADSLASIGAGEPHGNQHQRGVGRPTGEVAGIRHFPALIAKSAKIPAKMIAPTQLL